MTHRNEAHSLLRRLWCAFTHDKHKTWTPVHHSWHFRCLKCGWEDTIDD